MYDSPSWRRQSEHLLAIVSFSMILGLTPLGRPFPTSEHGRSTPLIAVGITGISCLDSTANRNLKDKVS